jgi:2-methylcitrate dehydratase PrpD
MAEEHARAGKALTYPPPAMPARKHSVVEELADFVVALELDDVPERVRELCRWQTASVLAAIYASRQNPAARAVREAVLGWDKAGRASVIGGSEKLAVHEAVLVNSAASMALDYDDYLYMGHTGHSSVLASLALGEAWKRSTREVLLAQVVANEIGGRVGASSVLGPQNGQAWSFIHALEGAAVFAKLAGLSRDETAHALSVALYQPTFTLWPGFMGPGSKVLTAATPTVIGLQAADFARHGLTGAREIFEHPRKGFWAAFTFAPLAGMLGGLGQSWVSDTLAFKRYPGCAYIDTTLDALFQILSEFRAKKGRNLAPAEVRRIRVDANLLTVEMDNLSSEHVAPRDPLSPINVNFSIPFNVAIAIVAGAHDGGTLTPEFLTEHDAPIRSLARKTELRHEWPLTFEVVRAFDGVLGKSGVLAGLGPVEIFAVLDGYRRQMGGRKNTSIRPAALVRRLGSVAAWTRRARSARRQRAGPTGIGNVDFTRFRMAFPVEVTLETTDLERYSARQDVPLGAPGQPARIEVAEQKLRHELGTHLDRDGIERVVGLIREFESSSLEDFVRAVTVAR